MERSVGHEREQFRVKTKLEEYFLAALTPFCVTFHTIQKDYTGEKIVCRK